ncbi:MAG: DUF4071 domain-containing protein [Bacteroidetes bacterium HGW-Bacteroidetes-12]|nr:MAG: DUF4071 domain-containing protein [Bacteroidetes bacterium HGW-Bacteroidetes-12]
MGFGVKTDFRSGRKLNLDKTYEHIIKPVFEGLDFHCFRADEIKHSGVIDKHMFEHIVKADFVIADISTLNPNSIYELGIRNAVKKHTTLIIAEKKMQEYGYPFDVNHISIDSYEHLESDIGHSEVLRFRAHLKNKIQELIKKPEVDSPLYSLIPNLETPKFTEEEIEELLEEKVELKSVSELLEESEIARKEMKYEKAIELLNEARSIYPENEFIIQRLVSVIYKSEHPNKGSALFEAEKILAILKPEISNDPETLGLSGAINKRLYEEYNDVEYLHKSLRFYERGYNIRQDYYNGINYAFMSTISSLKRDNNFEATADFGNGMIARKEVLKICENLINENSFKERDLQEKAWVYLTLAEIYFASDELDLEKEQIEKASEFAKEGQFEFNSYYEQRNKLEIAIKEFKNKYSKK